MTNQEALTELKASIECGFWCHKETYKMAIEALELQQRKKPKNIRVSWEWADEKDEYKEYVGLCPNCEEADVHSGANYCYNCGQMLDWSEVEDNDV